MVLPEASFSPAFSFFSSTSGTHRWISDQYVPAEASQTQRIKIAENCGSKASLCFPSSGLPHGRGHGRRLTVGWHGELVLPRWCQCGVQHRQLPQGPFWPAPRSHQGHHTALRALQARPRGLCSATGVISTVLAWLAPWGQAVVVLGTFNTLSAAAVSIRMCEGPL